MHREEELNLIECAACGTELEPGADRAFEFGTDIALCFDCGVARGGEYDAELETWTTEPDVSDLASEYDVE
ncbi:MAG: hypothetical protein ACQEXJ_13360 [Myxococcota bacterium]